METKLFEIEPKTLFSKSKIWQLNRDFYEFKGLSAFSENLVPHNLTTNSVVGKTYAELIFGLLNDLADKGKTTETVYILELGAGHGRLAFLILTQLESLINGTTKKLPPFSYILSDIIEENLLYFKDHPLFIQYFQKGLLDVSYFDAVGSNELYLRHAKKTIRHNELKQPIIALANYFFDSIPNELFLIKDNSISSCSISINSNKNPEKLNAEELIDNLELSFTNSIVAIPEFKNKVTNEILADYKNLESETYLLFPAAALACIENIKNLSSEGILLLSLDKGFHELNDLENQKRPDVVTHGSFSIWVNFHAIGAYCKKNGGKYLSPTYSSFNLELGAFMIFKNNDTYDHTKSAYQKFVNDFGPDDFNTIKKLSYSNVTRLSAKELIALYRLSAYDSTFFIKLLPRLKQVVKSITMQERKRIEQTMHVVWANYFSIGESFDLAYEIGNIFYDLGFYNEAINYFHRSIELHQNKPDTYYNMALSHYQLRQDKEFYETIAKAKKEFPAYVRLLELDKLDMK